jgi:hypothetical protein
MSLLPVAGLARRGTSSIAADWRGAVPTPAFHYSPSTGHFDRNAADLPFVISTGAKRSGEISALPAVGLLCCNGPGHGQRFLHCTPLSLRFGRNDRRGDANAGRGAQPCAPTGSTVCLMAGEDEGQCGETPAAVVEWKKGVLLEDLGGAISTGQVGLVTAGRAEVDVEVLVDTHTAALVAVDLEHPGIHVRVELVVPA